MTHHGALRFHQMKHIGMGLLRDDDSPGSENEAGWMLALDRCLTTSVCNRRSRVNARIFPSDRGVVFLQCPVATVVERLDHLFRFVIADDFLGFWIPFDGAAQFV